LFNRCDFSAAWTESNILAHFSWRKAQPSLCEPPASVCRTATAAGACCYHNGVIRSGNSAIRRVLHTIFLDRDGVLNEKMPEGKYVTSWDEFLLLPKAAESIARLNQAGLRVIVVSNQRGIARGLYTVADVDAIHARLQTLLQPHNAKIDGFYICPHDKEQCDCRKPLPGLFNHAVSDFPEITPESSAMVGDSLSDIEFGRNLGMLTVFIHADPEHRRDDTKAAADLADIRVASLSEAVDALL
jgi:D-glycero-D-manno-heptose 1,7-bisphosphate phosphatase